jgi:anti-sigma regulatory factor (Ser/Thr protein kinase)
MSVNSDPGRPPGMPGPRPEPAAGDLVDQEFGSGSLYALRAAVAAHATACGLGPVQVYEVVAAAHELAANAVRHGGGRGRIRLWADDRFLYCQVSDDGQVAPDEGRAPAAPPASWEAEEGHGLWLVREVADQLTLEHRTAGTTATARFAIGSPGQAPDSEPAAQRQGTPPH